MVERSIRIREARGSIPRSSRSFFFQKIESGIDFVAMKRNRCNSQYATNLKTSEIEGGTSSNGRALA